MTKHMTDSMDYDIGDNVTVEKWGNVQTGVVKNRRKTLTTYQYLITLENAGRVWVDEKHVR